MQQATGFLFSFEQLIILHVITPSWPIETEYIGVLVLASTAARAYIEKSGSILILTTFAWRTLQILMHGIL
jgi:hypothetical protein